MTNYFAKYCRTKNCRDNPYCLGRLGLEKWDKLLGCIKNENKTNTDLDRRDIAKMPCGLVNLGNSCYVNSFLQVFSFMQLKVVKNVQ